MVINHLLNGMILQVVAFDDNCWLDVFHSLKRIQQGKAPEDLMVGIRGGRFLLGKTAYFQGRKP